MAGSLLPPEKLGELRQLIHGHVSEAGIQEQIRTALSGILSQHGGRYRQPHVHMYDVSGLSLPLSRTLDEATLLEALEEKGIIEQVMTTLNLSRLSESEEPGLKGERRETKTEGERREESLVSPRHLHPRLQSPDGKINCLLHVCVEKLNICRFL